MLFIFLCRRGTSYYFERRQREAEVLCFTLFFHNNSNQKKLFIIMAPTGREFLVDPSQSSKSLSHILSRVQTGTNENPRFYS